MSKIVKNRSDAEMFVGWQEPEIPKSTFENTTNLKPRHKEQTTESHIPESVRKEMERLLMEMKLNFFRQGIQDVAYVLHKEGNSLKLTLEPKKKG